jgi:hypothetical protein
MGKRIDLIGKRFGKLTVIEKAPNKGGKTRWLCSCDCGNTTIVPTNCLMRGHSKSCGCLISEILRERDTSHGMYGTRLYRVWNNMKRRCYTESTPSYARYGGRGITVCAEWHDFKNFHDWAVRNGYKEDADYGDCTIDRIDNNGDYCPENCRWVSMKQQQRNRGNNRLITHDGETKTVAEWSELLQMDSSVIKTRLYRGWDEDRALTTPLRKRGRG